MTAFLLDTNVISELQKKRPNPLVTTWLTRTPDAFLSVLSIGEMLRGAQRISTRDPIRAKRIEAWVENVRSTYAGHLLEIDEDVADEWAQLPFTRTLPVIDSLLAATALTHSLTIATRNLTDFADLGVPLLNPFEDA